MAGETENPEDAAARLEAALERIARHAGARTDRPASEGTAGDGARVPAADLPDDPIGPAPPVDEIAARLDGLIDRLRAALTASSGSRPG